MSQEIDFEFEALLNDDGMADMMATDAGGPEASVAGAAAALKADDAAQVSVLEAKKQPAASSSLKQPAIGKKRQLLVPVSQQGPSKRQSLEVKAVSSGGSDRTASSLAAQDSPSPADRTADPAAATTEPEPSAASSPAKVKPTAASDSAENDTTKAADGTEDKLEGGATEMTDAAAEDEPEVQSPLKKCPRPDDDSAAAEDAPSTTTDHSEDPATTTTTAPSSKALAVGQRKGLTVAKVAEPKAPAKPKAAKPPKPAASNSTDSGGDDAAAATAGRKLPRANAAYHFFATEKRAMLKESEPGLSFSESSKRLGELWKALSEDDKRPYNAKADEDKEHVAAELAALGPAVVEAIKKAEADARAAKKGKKADNDDKAADEPLEDKQPTSSKAAAKEAKKAAAKAERAAKKEAKAAAQSAAARQEKAAAKEFHTSQYSRFKEDNPEMEPVELNGAIMLAWSALSAADKEVYAKRAEAAAEAAAAAKAATKAARSSKGGKKGSRGADASDGEDEVVPAGSRRRAAAAAEEDDDSDREDVDWESHPAAGIFGLSDGAFLVARERLMLTEYGKVDKGKAKAQMMPGSAGGGGADKLPVSATQIEEFERSQQKYWAAVRGRMVKGQLDLDELEEDSPLEACYVLGKLQEKGGLLDPNVRRPKSEPDMIRRMPAMTLSSVVQRWIDLERRNTALYKNRLAALHGAVQRLGGAELLEDEAVVAVGALLERGA